MCALKECIVLLIVTRKSRVAKSNVFLALSAALILHSDLEKNFVRGLHVISSLFFLLVFFCSA